MCSKIKKIIGFTSIRSDYDLMKELYFKLDKDPEIDFKLVVSGAHLSSSYGMTLREVEKDNFDILCRIESLLDSDSPLSRVKSATIMLQSMIDIVAQFSPDLLIYAGDREDVIMYALLGSFLNIPTVHFFGGDHVIDGHVDNPIRHATSKLSSFHFVSIDEHKERLIKMGETKDRIRVVGAVSLDRFNKHIPLTRKEVFNEMGINGEDMDYALVIFHPQDLEKEHSHTYLLNILETLEKRDFFIFVSFPNTDPGNKKIQEMIQKKSQSSSKIYFYKNLESDLFLSLFKNASIMVGNSSAGIVEAASIPIPVVNVGLRQLGRKANENVIFCDSNKEAIDLAVSKALSTEFKKIVARTRNFYGDGNSVEQAYSLIKGIDFSKFIYKTEDAIKE